MDNPSKLSLCIPTKNRWNFLKVNIPKYLENPFIDEIVICDENGDDAKNIREEYKDNEKIKVYINDTILEAFLNKRKVVSLATNEIVCLMDSDNFAPLSYFEAWDKYIQENGIKENTVYFPSRTLPQNNHPGFDHRDAIGSHDFEVFRSKYNKHINDFTNFSFRGTLNIGNFIVHKKLFCDSGPVDSQKDLTDSCKALDAHYQSYLLLAKGKAIFSVVPGMEYDHIVHDGSYWTTTCKEINISKFYKLFE
jgi:hypothetical protein